MDRVQAYRTLRLDQSADGRMVESAYWTLVRRAQVQAESDPAAAQEIEDLNRAYGVLSPDAMHYTAQAGQVRLQQPSSGVGLLDSAADWVNEEALRTRERWSGRNPEISVIGGATIIMMVMALIAGAPSLLVLLATLAVLVSIWAPWRRVHRDS
jgi:hypothetical protein